MLVISYKLTSFPRSVRQEGLFSLVAKSAGYNSKKKKKNALGPHDTAENEKTR